MVLVHSPGWLSFSLIKLVFRSFGLATLVGNTCFIISTFLSTDFFNFTLFLLSLKVLVAIVFSSRLSIYRLMVLLLLLLSDFISTSYTTHLVAWSFGL